MATKTQQSKTHQRFKARERQAGVPSEVSDADALLDEVALPDDTPTAPDEDLSQAQFAEEVGDLVSKRARLVKEPVMRRGRGRAGWDEAVIVPELDIRRVILTITGTAPYVSHAWSEKARKLMRDAQSGQPQQGKKKREGRQPQMEYEQSIYYTIDGKPGIPAIAFKAAGVDAANDVGLAKTRMKSAFHVEGGGNGVIPFTRYTGPIMREDPVRLADGTASLAYRAEFDDWQIAITIRYNAGVITVPHLVNLFRTAGFGIGVGEGRPKSPKSVGMGWGVFDVSDGIDFTESNGNSGSGKKAAK